MISEVLERDDRVRLELQHSVQTRKLSSLSFSFARLSGCDTDGGIFIASIIKTHLYFTLQNHIVVTIMVRNQIPHYCLIPIAWLFYILFQDLTEEMHALVFGQSLRYTVLHRVLKNGRHIE